MEIASAIERGFIISMHLVAWKGFSLLILLIITKGRSWLIIFTLFRIVEYPYCYNFDFIIFFISRFRESVGKTRLWGHFLSPPLWRNPTWLIPPLNHRAQCAGFLTEKKSEASVSPKTLTNTLTHRCPWPGMARYIGHHLYCDWPVWYHCDHGEEVTRYKVPFPRPWRLAEVPRGVRQVRDRVYCESALIRVAVGMVARCVAPWSK